MNIDSPPPVYSAGWMIDPSSRPTFRKLTAEFSMMAQDTSKFLVIQVQMFNLPDFLCLFESRQHSVVLRFFCPDIYIQPLITLLKRFYLEFNLTYLTNFKYFLYIFKNIHNNLCIYVKVMMQKKCFSRPLLVQVLSLKMITQVCNFHHMYTSTVRDRMGKQEITW